MYCCNGAGISSSKKQTSTFEKIRNIAVQQLSVDKQQLSLEPHFANDFEAYFLDRAEDQGNCDI